MSEFKRYTRYKESGIEWLGEVPDKWKIKKLKYLININSGEAPPNDKSKLSGNYPIMGANGIIGYSSMTNLIKKSIIIGRVGASGEINITDTPCWVSDNALIVKIINNINFMFLYYALLSANLNSLVSKNAQPLITGGLIKNIHIPIPCLEEQNPISNYLTHKTSQIDTLIENKQKLIELLKECRTAVINQAVTKGLNPDVPMKDSGIPSIGEIPIHWEVKRNKTIFRESKAKSTTGKEELLTVSHITGITPRSQKDVNMFLAESMEGYKLCEPDNLIINTMWAWMGALGITEYNGLVSPSYNVYQLRNREEYIPKYLDLFYRTPPYICEIVRYSKGIWSSRLRLYPEYFFEMSTLTPPLSEQIQIVHYINDKLRKIDNIIPQTERLIAFLKEYRTALISDVVTGKIDVRGEV